MMLKLKQDERYCGVFREACKPFIILGQFFGVLPVCGLNNGPKSVLQFKWTSFRAVYSLFVIIIFSVYSLFLLWRSFNKDNNYASINILLFYISSTIGVISYFEMATKWAELINCWETIEKSLPTFDSHIKRRNFVLKIRIFTFSIIGLAMIENFLATHSKIVMDMYKGKEPFGDVVRVQGPIGDFEGQPPVIAIICSKVLNLYATFFREYTDIFITVTSFTLSVHLKNFNTELERVDGMSLPKLFWMYKREEYGRLRDLINTVDQRVAHVTLLTFCNHFYHICAQLYKSLRQHSATYRKMYFWFSFIFLIVRAAIFCFAATSIYDESKKPSKILRHVPSQTWNAETKRFLDDVTSDTIALSGMRFFFITRQLILSVVGLIVTYQLCIAQFER